MIWDCGVGDVDGLMDAACNMELGNRMENAPGCEDFLPHVWLAYVVTGMEGCSLYPNCWKVRLGGLKEACVHKSTSMPLIHAPLQLNHFMCVGR